jgi:hypothetical protein
MSTQIDTPPTSAPERSDRDCQAINLAGHLLVAAVWAERRVARRLKAPSHSGRL